MIVFDVEADGLLDQATKIHCLSYTDDGNNYKTLFDYSDMRDLILSQRGLVGHNIIRYDVPLIEKILGIKVTARLFDTLPMSWVLNYDRSKHGLESFGEDFGIPKPKIDDWQNLTQEEYAHRCTEDVKINWCLWQDVLKRFMFIYKDKSKLDKFFRYLEFKMDCASVAERVGWKLDIQLAQKCVDDLTTQKSQKESELIQVMPKRRLTTKKTKPKNCFKKDGTPSAHGQRWFDLLQEHGLPPHYDGEVEVTKGWEDPNPNSTDQVKDWLYSLGWEPCTFKYDKNKETGEERKIPQVRRDGELTDSVKLIAENNPAVEVLEGLTVMQHRLKIFEAFLECEHNGYVRAEIDGLTNTLRFKHKKPLVNLPGVDRPWGKEIRGCLIAPPGYILCGADMTSLEDTTKRHYMYPYDPDYVHEMSQEGFDPHLDLAKHAGAITQSDIDAYNRNERDDLKAMRKNFKVVNYSATYGVGAAKLSRTTGMAIPHAQSLLDAYWERNWSVKAFAEAQKIRKINGEMWVQNPVSGFWHSLRYEKDVFSTLNQSTGAYCFDKWVAYYRTRRPNIIGQFHDESINLVKQGEQNEHSDALNWAIEKLNQELKLNVDLGIDIQYGQRYSDVH
jgi:DNA polymerase I-like protein with 3'-5' exonuclease and polymerase domains